MRYLLTLSLAVALAVPAGANDFSPSSRQDKTDTHLLQNRAYDGREGGETIETAVPIPVLPYYDTGATCDNLDDYDEECPYGPSWSPDVVYSYTPYSDEVLHVDLCASLYDTKVFMYDEQLNLVACNDDAGCGITGWQSELWAVEVQGGTTYYIVVDGYGGDCGEYDLVVDLIYVDDCPPVCDGMPEGEPDLVPDYVDSYNGGCNSDPEVWQTLVGDLEGEVSFCGVGGWYDYQGTQYRDTDWFIATAGNAEVSVELQAGAELRFIVLESSDCSNIVIRHDVTIPYCFYENFVFATEPGAAIYFVILPTYWQDPDTFLYDLNISGLQVGVVGAEDVSFGAVKALYR